MEEKSQKKQFFKKNKVLTLKEAFIDLQNRLMKQKAEKIWEIERVKGIKEKSEEWNIFAGSETIKKNLLERLKKELKEREMNLKTLEEIIKKNKYGKRKKRQK